MIGMVGLLLVCLCMTVHTLDIEPLLDGVVVTQGESLDIEEGVWTLLLTIEEAGKDFRRHERDVLSREALGLRRFIMNQTSNNVFTSEKMDVWDRTLRLIRMDPFSPFAFVGDNNPKDIRGRRSVLPIIGEGLNWIFGTATEDQVLALQSQVDIAKSSQDAIVHNVEQLITIVDQSKQERREMQKNLDSLAGAHNAFVRKVQARWMDDFTRDQVASVDRLVNTLGILDQGLYRESAAIDRLHAIIRGGRVTEEVCPPRLVSIITKRARTLGLEPLPLEWYYENVFIRPILISDGKTVYQIELPFVRNTDYLLYELKSFPVPTPNSTDMQIVLEKHIATDTTTGSWFVPQGCRGHNPSLCRTGALYKDAYPCERGLVLNHRPDRNICKLRRVSRRGTKASEVNRGTYVLQTDGEDVSQLCHGKTPEKAVLTQGTYLVTLAGQCTMRGEGWAINGEIIRFGRASARLQRLDVPAIDIASLDTDNTLNNFDSHDVEIESEVLDDEPYNWQDMHEQYTPGVVGHHLGWLNSVIILILCIACLVGLGWIYKRRDRLRFFLTRKRHRIKLLSVKSKTKQETNTPEVVVDNVNDDDVVDTDV